MKSSGKEFEAEGAALGRHEPPLFGKNSETGLVALEPAEGKPGNPDEMVLFFRRDGTIVQEHERFEPFILAAADILSLCPIKHTARPLAGGGTLNACAVFPSWDDCVKASKWLAKETGRTSSAQDAPYLFLSDPVHQHLVLTGRTLFLSLAFENVRRVQVDIECLTTPGYEFCNAEREGDRIIAIAVGDETGKVEVLSGVKLDEKKLLEAFVELIRRKDPDVIEGHNIFNFDLPYLAERAKRHGVKLRLGRDGSVPRRRPSRFSAAERTIAYDRFDLFGRHIVDTLFLVHAYDVSHRELDGFGLKEVAVHFGLASKDRTYIPGAKISEAFRKDPDRVMRYVGDDVAETRELSALLSRSHFAQAQILPYAYQNVCVRGNAAKIDALMLREYLRQGHAVPQPGQTREFEGGYTDIFVQGVVENVHHCDVRSLYPSLMLTRRLAPAKDELGIFLQLLNTLKVFRLEAKASMQKSSSPAEKNHFDALQATFKILINSFYGYLGFSQARFCDFDAAEKVTEGGRAVLRGMIEWLKQNKATPVEIDTDGIYFVPPAFKGAGQLEAFREALAKSLPEGIEVEFDGEYRSMYSYRMKNYALLTHGGEVIIKGAALKSRGLEPFQREFLREVVRLKLEERDKEIPALKERFEKEIRGRTRPIEWLAKTENLQDAPSTYSAKIGDGKRARSAAYELALRSGREYRAGDQVSYYVTGTKKSVAVHTNSKLVTDWDPKNRDENVDYYLAKLEALYEKFTQEPAQAELGL